ncbi:MAG: ATP-binding cassette domain-containing protein, partial [Stackebrandtia sp.]
AAARLTALLDAPAPVAEPGSPVPLPQCRCLTLRDVRPKPPARAGDDPLSDAADGARKTGTTAADGRRGVDLDLPRGRRVALVGASGAGKTMLLNALTRFVDLERGSIRLGGVELSDLRGDDVRTVIGGMAADAHLFHATIRENLALAARGAGADVDDATLREALTRAGAGDLDLSTVVGEDGALLSGGQRQRVLLARALLADHPILLLDEPVEHLDPDVADRLVDDLLSAASGRSMILSTHRLAGLDRMDEIVVLDEGAVVQRGTHAELIAVPGRYRRWRQTQNAGTIAAAEATITP